MKIIRPLNEISLANLLHMAQGYGLIGLCLGFFLGISFLIFPGVFENQDYLLLFLYPILLFLILAIEIYTRKKVFPELEKRLKE